MYDGNNVAVVVPAYNEAGLVGEVIETIPEFVDRTYVVDDDSTDGTWEEIREHAEKVNRTGKDRLVRPLADGGKSVVRDSTSGRADGDEAVVDGDTGGPADADNTADRVVPIRHDENRGVGGAIKTGYRRAYDDGMDIVAVMAGDGQMDPDHLDRLLDPIAEGDADYAKGNRLLYPEFRRAMPKFRLFGNALLTYLTKIASGYWRTGDPQNGYTAISREALDVLDVDDLYDDYGFANELLVRLNRHGMGVADVAMPAVYGDEESTIEYRTFVPRLSGLLLTSFLGRLAGKYGLHPVATGYAVGALGVVAALATGLSAAFDAAGAGTPMLLAGFGLSSLGIAMYLDAATDAELETQVTSRPTDS